MNEVPAGMRWPSSAEQLARTEEALTIIARLLDGETVDFAGRFFTTKGAVLYSRPERRPPVFLSAFHEGAAELAGREAGAVIVQASYSYAAGDEQALAAAREWKGTLIDLHYTDDVADPAQIYRNGEDEVSDAEFTKQVICSADPATHVRRIREIEKLGPDVVVLMNVSGADPHAALRVYGERVLPELRARG